MIRESARYLFHLAWLTGLLWAFRQPFPQCALEAASIIVVVTSWRVMAIERPRRHRTRKV
jgi:hypothetical protein